MLQQICHLARLRGQGDGFGKVLRQQNPASQPCLNVIGGDTPHFSEVVVQVVANGVALQVVVVQRK